MSNIHKPDIAIRYTIDTFNGVTFAILSAETLLALYFYMNNYEKANIVDIKFYYNVNLSIDIHTNMVLRCSVKVTISKEDLSKYFRIASTNGIGSIPIALL